MARAGDESESILDCLYARFRPHREVAALVNGVRHRAAEKIHVVSEDHHEADLGRIGGGANLRENFFAILGDPFRLARREAVG